MSDTNKPKNSSQLAEEALAVASADVDEVATSDQLAETLQHLQAVIERNANELAQLNQKLKEKRLMFKNVIKSDANLAELEEEYVKILDKLKEAKARVQSSPEATSLKTQIAELNEQKKEIEETLSSHLLNYYQLTGSTSFDTSDGDQWEFIVKARVKNRKK